MVFRSQDDISAEKQIQIIQLNIYTVFLIYIYIFYNITYFAPEALNISAQSPGLKNRV